MKITFFKKRTCLLPTWYTTLFFFLILIWLGVWGMRQLPGFLSKNTKTGTGYLVIDGHMPDYLIEAAIDIYAAGNYKKVIVTGGALPSGYYISGVKNMAELSYKTFLTLEFDSTQIIAVPGGTSLKNRTYNSGLNLAAWFKQNQIDSAQVEIVSLGCHARRSFVLFQRALGDNFQVGVISIPDRSYDARKWWKSSKGLRTVISETLAYFYIVMFS